MAHVQTLSRALPPVRPADPTSFRGMAVRRMVTEHPSWITGEAELPSVGGAGRATILCAKVALVTGCVASVGLSLGSLVFFFA